MAPDTSLETLRPRPQWPVWVKKVESLFLVRSLKISEDGNKIFEPAVDGRGVSAKNASWRRAALVMALFIRSSPVFRFKMAQNSHYN
jgi:hypothetical protein